MARGFPAALVLAVLVCGLNPTGGRARPWSDFPLNSIVPDLGGPREKLCDTCMQVVTAAHTILTDQEVADDLIAIVEKQVCGKLPVGEAKTKCNTTVQQYVPMVLSMIDNELSFEKMCIKTKICPSQEEGREQGKEEVEEAKGSSDGDAIPDINDASDCLACKLVVKIIRRKLSDPKVQEKILDFLLSKCAALSPANVAAECTKATGDILPIVFEKLPQILDPKKLCVQAGLCKERLVEAQ